MVCGKIEITVGAGLLAEWDMNVDARHGNGKLVRLEGKEVIIGFNCKGAMNSQGAL